MPLWAFSAASNLSNTFILRPPRQSGTRRSGSSYGPACGQVANYPAVHRATKVDGTLRLQALPRQNGHRARSVPSSLVVKCLIFFILRPPMPLICMYVAFSLRSGTNTERSIFVL